jgi:enolase
LRDGGARYGGKGVKRAVPPSARRNRSGRASAQARRAATRRPASCWTSTAPRTRASWAPTPSSVSRWRWRKCRRRVGRICRCSATWAGRNAHLLPVPMMNILNGGAHADTNVDIQEFMIAPIGAPTYSRGAALGRRGLPRAQGGAARSAGCPPTVGDEGGFAPDVPGTRAALDLISRGHRVKAGFTPGADVALALDVAATEFYTDGTYAFEKKTLRRGDDGSFTRSCSTPTRSCPSRTRSPKMTGTVGRR